MIVTSAARLAEPLHLIDPLPKDEREKPRKPRGFAPCRHRQFALIEGAIKLLLEI